MLTVQTWVSVASMVVPTCVRIREEKIIHKQIILAESHSGLPKEIILAESHPLLPKIILVESHPKTIIRVESHLRGIILVESHLKEIILVESHPLHQHQQVLPSPLGAGDLQFLEFVEEDVEQETNQDLNNRQARLAAGEVAASV